MRLFIEEYGLALVSSIVIIALLLIYQFMGDVVKDNSINLNNEFNLTEILEVMINED